MTESEKLEIKKWRGARMRIGVLNAERIVREIREQGYTGSITVQRSLTR